MKHFYYVHISLGMEITEEIEIIPCSWGLRSLERGTYLEEHLKKKWHMSKGISVWYLAEEQKMKLARLTEKT